MRRIAIVEDEPSIRANYLDALARRGYEVAGYASLGEYLNRRQSRAKSPEKS